MTFLVTNYVLFTLSPLIHSSLITKFTRKKIEWFSIYQRENEQKKIHICTIIIGKCTSKRQ
jgi:hypothetical protein